MRFSSFFLASLGMTCWRVAALPHSAESQPVERRDAQTTPFTPPNNEGAPDNPNWVIEDFEISMKDTTANISSSSTAPWQSIGNVLRDWAQHVDHNATKGERTFHVVGGGEMAQYIPADTVLMCLASRQSEFLPSGDYAVQNTSKPLHEALYDWFTQKHVTSRATLQTLPAAMNGPVQMLMAYHVFSFNAFVKALPDGGKWWTSSQILNGTDAANAFGLNKLGWNDTAGLGPPPFLRELGPDGLELPRPAMVEPSTVVNGSGQETQCEDNGSGSTSNGGNACGS